MSSVFFPFLVTRCSWTSSTAPSAWKGRPALVEAALAEAALAAQAAAALVENALFVAALVIVQAARLVSVVMALAYAAIAMARVWPLTMALRRVVTCVMAPENVTGVMELAIVPHVMEKAIINIFY